MPPLALGSVISTACVAISVWFDMLALNTGAVSATMVMLKVTIEASTSALLESESATL